MTMANLNQIRRARVAAKKAGVRMTMRGKGADEHVHFAWPDGRKEAIWYPNTGCVDDLDEKALEAAITLLTIEGAAHERT